MASSSDIPVGLEPLLFPDDFVWPEDQPNLCTEIRNHLDEYCGIKSLALVDGGVIDNQGIESVLLAAHEVNKADTAHPPAQAVASSQSLMGVERFGLYIVSDAPIVEDDIYNPKYLGSCPDGRRPELRISSREEALLWGDSQRRSGYGLRSVPGLRHRELRAR